MKISALIAIVLLTGCASANLKDVGPGDADAAIAKQNASFVAAARAGNVDQLMNFYSETAVVMPPNAPAVSGRPAIRQFWSGLLGAMNVEVRLTTDDVNQGGDVAAERGHFDFTMTPKQGGAPIHEVGKYVVVWRKLNGKWMAVNDIFNSDLAK